MSRAVLLEQLSNGATNTSFLVQCEGESFVLRLDKPEAARLGLDRSNEYRVCLAASDAGLTPRPVFSDLAAGVYLRRFQTGTSWVVSDLNNPVQLEQLARLLAKLHSLPLVGETRDLIVAARRYASQHGSEQSQMILIEAEGLWQQLGHYPSGLSICHNDLVCQNILDGEALMLIDWEYAGIGDRFFDLAVVVQHHGLAPNLKAGFLASYLGRPTRNGELNHLDLQCRFYACLLQLWNLRIAGA
jgi:thiamine kinase-like enzyme